MISTKWNRRLRTVGVMIAAVGVIAPSGLAAAATAPQAMRPTASEAADPDGSAEDAAPGEYVVTLRSPRADGHSVVSASVDLSSRVDAVLTQLDEAVGGGRASSQQSVDTDESVIAELPIIDGFGARLSPAEAAILASFDDVVSVTPNKWFATSAAPIAPSPTGAADLPWGLDRIDQKKLPLDGSYSPPGDGAGVTAYVLDQGVWGDHQEFKGRIEPMVDFVGDSDAPEDELDPASCFAHGTHVAGTIAGTNVGVAPKARIQSVRVLGCGGGGYLIDILRGMDWVGTHAELPAVVNMSLGAHYDSSIGFAIRFLTAKGITVVVAAGNDYADACGSSPAAEPAAITVGATDVTDTAVFFSNFGPCVDLFAPGERIESASVYGPDQYALGSGTSMASPHVAGTAALYLSAHPNATPDAVERAIVAGTVKNVVKQMKPDTANRFLQVDDLPDPVNNPNTDPVAHIAPPGGFGPFTVGTPVTLNGGGSFDPGGGALSFEWRVQGKAGVAGTKPTLTVTPEQFGSFEVTLKVTNESGASGTTTLIAETIGSSPVLILDPADQLVRAKAGDVLSWDASASYDPDGGRVDVYWHYEDGVFSVDSSGPTFSATYNGENAFVSIALVNQIGVATFGLVRIRPSGTPVAVVAPSSVKASVGETVEFDASKSYLEPDVGEKLTYAWRDTAEGMPVASGARYRRTFDEPGTFTVFVDVVTASGDIDTAKATVVVTREPAAMSGIDPVRVLDTRMSSPQVPGPKGTLGAGGVARLTVGDIPLSAAGVVLNVTAVNPAADGHLTVYPCGDRPSTSNVNYRAGVTSANAVVSLLGRQHELCVWSYAPTDVVVDVTGYVRTGSPAHSIEPVRAIDTRVQVGDGFGRLLGGGVVKVPVSSVAEVPKDASAVFVNVTAVNPAADGHLTVYPCGTVPATSNVNYRAGVTKANMAVVKMTKDGSLCVKTHAETDVVVDILGYVDAGRSVTLNSVRSLDTRNIASSPGQAGPVAGGSTVKVNLGVDPAKVTGVFLNLAAVNPAGDGHLTVFPCGEPPTASMLNYRAGVTTSNMVFAEVDNTGSVCVLTHATTDLVVDFNGTVAAPA